MNKNSKHRPLMDALEVAIARHDASPQAIYQNMMSTCDQDEKEIAGLKADNERLREAWESAAVLSTDSEVENYKLKEEIDDLKERNKGLNRLIDWDTKEIKKLIQMIDNGLGWEDMENDIKSNGQ